MPESNLSDPQRTARFAALSMDFEGTFVWITERLQDEGVGPAEAVNQAADRLESLMDAAKGPVFDEDGYIAPIQKCTESECVLWFGTNEHREALLERVRNWIELARAVGTKRLLLDGSLLTAKEEPEDVDAAILLPDDFHEQLRAGRPEAVELLVALFTREPRELLFAEVEEDWWGWVEFFGRTRELSGRRKGLMEVVL